METKKIEENRTRLHALFQPPNSHTTNILIGKTIDQANQFLEDNDYFYDIDYNYGKEFFYVCDGDTKDIRSNRIRVNTENGKIVTIKGVGR